MSRLRNSFDFDSLRFRGWNGGSRLVGGTHACVSMPAPRHNQTCETSQQWMSSLTAFWESFFAFYMMQSKCELLASSCRLNIHKPSSLVQFQSAKQYNRKNYDTFDVSCARAVLFLWLKIWNFLLLFRASLLTQTLILYNSARLLAGLSFDSGFGCFVENHPGGA